MHQAGSQEVAELVNRGASTENTMSTKPVWEAFVRSDVYAGEFTEDGDRREELSYYIVCEDERGYRFRSHACFTTDEFSRDEAQGRANALCERVNAFLAQGHSPVASPKWTPIQGCYGSAAWDETAELDLEARDLDIEAGPAEGDRFRRHVGLGA